MLKSFRVALVFLSTLPVSYPVNASASERRDSLFWYPLVGAVIGFAMWLSGLWLPAGSVVSAGLILTLWIVLTGALHLDGLADCADAWVGGHGNRQKMLQIMKDPAAGVMAVVTLIIVIGLKFLAIAELMGSGSLAFLIVVPALARLAPMLLFLSTSYVRNKGIGRELQIGVGQRPLIGVISAATIVSAILLLGWQALWLILVGGLIMIVVRRVTMRRLGGFTGDVAGAAIELVELGCCVTLALI